MGPGGVLGRNLTSDTGWPLLTFPSDCRILEPVEMKARGCIMADRVGQQLGHYRLLQILGRGGFADVYLGEHVHLGTRAAIKVLSAKLEGEDSEPFRAESRLIARLDHPHIVRVLEREEPHVRTFEDAQVDIKPRLKSERQNKAYKEFLEGLRKKTPVWTIYDAK